MTRVFLDANVIIAASKSSSGESRAIFRLSRRREDITLLTTVYAWEDEAECALQRENPDALVEFYSLRQDLEVHPEPSVVLLAQVKSSLSRRQQLPRKDLPILAGAISVGADLLLTHDEKHFGHLYERRVLGVKILSPIAGLRLLEPRP